MERPLFLYITILSQTVIAVLVPFLWKRSTFSQRCVVILLVEMALASLVEFVMGMHGIRNLWVMHCSTLVEFVIIMTLFYGWKESRSEKRLLLIIGLAFVTLWLVAKTTFEPFDHMDVYTSIVAEIIYIILSVSLLFTILKDALIPLKNDIRVWFASGLIIYSAGTLFVFSLFNIIIEFMPELFVMIWHINWILVILTTFFYARGVWCRVKQ